MSHKFTRFQPGAALLLLTVLGLFSACSAGPVPIPAPVVDSPKASGPLQVAVLAGGCFWGTQGVFEHLTGVKRVLSGYAGGAKETAQYATVSDGFSGHAESVQILFDPQQVSYGQILQVFFSVAHDPTQLNRQGPDAGTQYRSAIFYADDTQKKIAQAYIAQLQKSGAFRTSIVTRVDPLQGFYPAEDYHQDYLLNNPRDTYIVFNDLPKIRAFQRVLPQLYRDEPVTVAASAPVTVEASVQ
jgi:peptide-methionine (S)-S-oxide reductase